MTIINFCLHRLPCALVMGTYNAHTIVKFVSIRTETENIHVPTGLSSCFFHLRRTKSVRRILGAEVTSGLVSAFVTTRLDYCNSVLAGLPQSTIDPLQRVQNAAARLVAGTGTRDHITPVLRSLYTGFRSSSALSTSSACSCTWCELVAVLRTRRT